MATAAVAAAPAVAAVAAVRIGLAPLVGSVAAESVLADQAGQEATVVVAVVAAAMEVGMAAEALAADLTENFIGGG